MTHINDDFAQTLEHELEANEASHMLQPYVDGELADEERERVAHHLEHSAQARRYVQQQQEVRTLLQGLEPARAPERLRARVVDELDAIDAARDQAVGGGGGRLLRLRSAFRGAMIMMPAAAAAVGLFFVVKSGALVSSPSADNGVALQGSTAALVDPLVDRATAHRDTDGSRATDTDGARGPAPAADIAAVTHGTPLDADGIDFPKDFVAPTSLPEGVRLVSASRDSAQDAGSQLLTVEYIDRASGDRYVDVQRPLTMAGLDPTSSGLNRPDAVSVRIDGTRYELLRDAAGRAQVRFSDTRVDHTLRHRGTDRARVDGPVSADDPDFVELLALARAVSTPAAER